MDYFLGLDCSTQSFSGIIIDFQEKTTVFSHSINFDVSLPQYETLHGVYTSEDGKVVHSNPLMWVEALELLFTKFSGKITFAGYKANKWIGPTAWNRILKQNF